MTIIFTIATVGCGSTTNQVSDQLKYQASDVNSIQVQSYNQFAMKLYSTIVDEMPSHSNIFISPTSIAAALSMTLNGAKGETFKAMQKSLELQNMTMEEINHSNQILINLLQYSDPSVELSIANSLWTREGKNLHLEFIDTNQEFYDAVVQELDFSSPTAADTINQWVQESTNDKIDGIVEHPLNANSILFLINAIYFKGDWTEPFEKSNTQQRPFYLSDGSTTEVAMMSQGNSFDYLHTDQFEAIRLPYGEQQWNMIVILPDPETSLPTLYPELLESPETWLDGYQEKNGTLQFPRFQMEFEMELNDTLKAMGMEIAFDDQQANFSGMANIPPNIFIGNVKHKSFIEVNEEGTEAAAVTSVEMDGSGPPEPGFDMIVDRPFFIAIEDRSTGALMFMGSVEHP